MIRAIPLLAVAAIGLSGCISLFPKAEPLTTYKLSVNTPAPSATAGTGAVVLKSTTLFPRAAAADRILTVSGPEAATIAGARWVAPASVMFDEALSAAFASTTTRLTTRGDITPADQIMRIEVRTFEARYLGGEGAAPTVVIEARAGLTNIRDRQASTSREFRAEQAAADNRVGAIVDAYNAATTQLVTDIARWTESQAPARRVG
jgi:cholesterol transport system auxiliary component